MIRGGSWIPSLGMRTLVLGRMDSWTEHGLNGLNTLVMDLFMHFNVLTCLGPIGLGRTLHGCVRCPESLSNTNNQPTDSPFHYPPAFPTHLMQPKGTWSQ